MKARVYVAAAIEDRGFDDAQKLRLGRRLPAPASTRRRNVPARHGWVPSDTPVHDEAQTERHWRTLLNLFEETLVS